MKSIVFQPMRNSQRRSWAISRNRNRLFLAISPKGKRFASDFSGIVLAIYLHGLSMYWSVRPA